MTATSAPLNALRHHVSGAIERGEKDAITCQPFERMSVSEAIETLDANNEDIATAIGLAYGLSIPCGQSWHDWPTGLASDVVSMFERGALPRDIGVGKWTYGQIARLMLAYRMDVRTR